MEQEVQAEQKIGPGWLRQLQLTKAKEIKLDEVGLQGFWIKVIDPGTKPYGWLSRMGKFRRTGDLENLPQEEVEGIFQEQKKLLSELIIDWNFINSETGERLKIPAECKDDESTLDLLPVVVITAVNDKIGELFEAMGPRKLRGS